MFANVDWLTRAESAGRTVWMTVLDLLVVFGVGLALLFAFVFWAKYARRRRKHVGGGEKVYRDSATPEDDGDESDVRRRYKRRVRRRDHRSRNPTLAETGGLPPVRSPDPSDPS